MVKMLLEVDGIRGHTLLEGEENQMLIHDFDIGLSNHVSWLRGRAESAGPEVAELALQKGIDRGTPQLMQSVVNGTEHQTARFSVVSDDGGEPIYVLDMKGVRITAVSNDSEDSSALGETVTLTFSEITVEFTEFDHTGTEIIETFTFDRFEPNAE